MFEPQATLAKQVFAAAAKSQSCSSTLFSMVTPRTYSWYCANYLVHSPGAEPAGQQRACRTIRPSRPLASAVAQCPRASGRLAAVLSSQTECLRLKHKAGCKYTANLPQLNNYTKYDTLLSQA